MSAPFEREIEGLHDFFVDWYCAELDKAAFSRVESALSPEFERISPDFEAEAPPSRSRPKTSGFRDKRGT